MDALLGVVVFAVGVLLSIALHEIGHLVPAKRFGVKVPQYMVGFGPTLWSRTRGETEYGIKAIPLGGYVRLVGMYPPARGARTLVGSVAAGAPEPTDAAAGAGPGVVEPRSAGPRFAEPGVAEPVSPAGGGPLAGPTTAGTTGRIGRLIEDARAASAAELAPGEEHRAFYRLSVPRKIVVMLGGPVMNLLIAVALFAVTMMGVGVPVLTSTVGTVSQCILPVDAPARDCADADPVAPAASAGLRPGDRVISFDGTMIDSWEDLSAAIRDSGASPVTVEVLRDGELIALQATPVVAERPVWDDAGPVRDDQGRLVTRDVGFLGIAPAEELRRQSAGEVASFMGGALVQTGRAIATLPEQLAKVVRAVVSDEERGTDSIVSVVGVGRFAGEVTSADLEGFGWTEKAASLLQLLGATNLALFAFNLIPLLPLDGGHVAGALFEGLRRRWARLRGRPDPGPADTARLVPLTYLVGALLLGVGLLLIVADVVKPVTLL